jgi:uncharacterized protein YjbI with pentapeptide repeats
MNIDQFLAEYKAGKRDFRGVNLQNAKLTGLKLSGIDLTEADLTGCKLYAVDFNRSGISRY